MEIWKDIQGYEGLYQVSNYGNIKNIKTGKIKKAEKTQRGYLRVLLSNGRHKQKHKRIHRIVAETFISNSNGLSDVNHINGNKLDNRADNLEWCTKKENVRHYILTQKKKRIIQLDKNSNLIKIWNALFEIEEQLHIDRRLVCMCCNNKIKSAYGYLWKYEMEG